MGRLPVISERQHLIDPFVFESMELDVNKPTNILKLDRCNSEHLDLVLRCLMLVCVIGDDWIHANLPLCTEML